MRLNERVEEKTMQGCSCGCTQRFSDLLRAAQPVKKSSLIKVTCAGCEKVFWTNFEKQYCFNCEAKKRKKDEYTSV